MADELMNLENLQQVLEDLARDIEAGYKDSLERNDHYTTLGSEARKLLRSIKTHVEVGEQSFEVTMDLEHYWKYVEEGVRGDRNATSPYKNPGWKAYPFIAQWIQVKPIIPRPGASGRIPSPKSLAYLFTRSIVRHGTTGTHDLQKTKDAVIPMYRERISAALGRDVENYIRKVFHP